MSRRRVYAPLSRPDEQEREPAGADLASLETQPEAPVAPAADSMHARVLALQQGAGNAATARLLRKRAALQGLAREPDDAVASPDSSSVAVDLSMRKPGPPASPDAPPDVAMMTKRYSDQLRRENAILHVPIVPQILDRLTEPSQMGTPDSLAEITLLARDRLKAYLRENVLQGEGPTQVATPVADIQQVVTIVARERNLIIPDDRSSSDKTGLEGVGKALAGLSGLKLPNLAIEGSAAGFKIRFNGELAASRKIGGTDVSIKSGLGGNVEGRVGPVTAGGSLAKDGAKLDLKLTAGPVELRGDIKAKAGEPTTWSAALEVKIGAGDALPDRAALTDMIQTAGNDVTEAAKHLGSAVAGSADVDKKAIDEKLKPAKESIEKVAGYISKHSGAPSGPRATVGVTAKGSEGGAVSATVTLTIGF